MKEILLFSIVPISIEMVAPIQTTIAVCLMIPFAVHAFEDVRTWLAFLGGCSICFLVVHTTSHFLSVVFSRMSSIVLGTPGDMRTATKCQMSPLPTVLVLQDTWVHIGTFDGSNKMSDVEAMIDAVLRQRTALGIPDIHPDHCHV